MQMQKITTFLMFESGAEEAAKLYTSIFTDSKITDISHMGDGPAGPMTSVSFEIGDQRFAGFDGGPHFSFSEGMSIMVNCETQEEVDDYWEKLTADGGEESMCGWLKDRFGVSWQIVPTVLFDLIGDSDHEKAKRATDAMLQMKKLDISALKKAHAGE